ncbi:hypothetical protein HMPREF9248_1136 [Fannyhessea vaginae PB189-T1-4]|uniref:Uncharacterized protein n=1 Tax=Fannyhessea vaginae PB189-T1-4 TaxID=866774 RepID=A0ABN0B0Z3_9ACTN|nr:hypothetical protein HMPREF9248_1136 [Fannyhessea vaginae PB189-T1-4]
MTCLLLTTTKTPCARGCCSLVAYMSVSHTTTLSQPIFELRCTCE